MVEWVVVKWVAVLIGIVLLAGVGYFVVQRKPETVERGMVKTGEKTIGEGMAKFGSPKKSAHWESNTPEHGVTLAGVPVNVVVDFNFDLAEGSTISITQKGQEFGEGETVIDANKLAMRRSVRAGAPDGAYAVEYKACWPDGSCHDGSFQFAVDRGKTLELEDMRGKKEVSVRMSQIKFAAMNVRIDRGTKVTWVNDDEVEHFVNTDSHPAHTYYRSQNSRSLAKGNTYAMTFDKPGVYPYHCSAHADVMKGTIVVE